MRGMLFTAIIGLAGLMQGQAQTLFTGSAGGNNNWFDGANWAPAGVPNAGSGTVLINFGNASFDPVVVDDSLTTATAQAPVLVLSELAGQNNYLNIATDLATTGDFRTEAGMGLINQTGGAVSVGGNFVLGDTANGSGYGLYGMSGTSLEVSGSMSLNGVSATSVLVQEAGLMTVEGGLAIGTQADTTGTYRISGESHFEVVGTISVGSASASRTAGNGTLLVDGSSSTGYVLTGGFELNNTTALGDPPPSVLEVAVDAAAASDPDSLLRITVVGDAHFDDGAYLFPRFNGTAPEEHSWTVMTWSGTLTDLGLELHPDTAPGWDMSLAGGELTIFYQTPVPEPASGLLLLAGGLAALARRRRGR